jgi:hypothetical protein
VDVLAKRIGAALRKDARRRDAQVVEGAAARRKAGERRAGFVEKLRREEVESSVSRSVSPSLPKPQAKSRRSTGTRLPGERRKMFRLLMIGNGGRGYKRDSSC